MKITNQRQGASLVVVLALLAVCSAILFQLLSAGLQQRFQMRRDLQREQTQWLLRAGEQNAAMELKKNNGELPSKELPNLITVELPDFEAASLSYTKDAESSDPSIVKVSAQIGNPETPHEMTALSSELKVRSDDNNNPNQE